VIFTGKKRIGCAARPPHPPFGHLLPRRGEGDVPCGGILGVGTMRLPLLPSGEKVPEGRMRGAARHKVSIRKWSETSLSVSPPTPSPPTILQLMPHPDIRLLIKPKPALAIGHQRRQPALYVIRP